MSYESPPFVTRRRCDIELKRPLFDVSISMNSTDLFDQILFDRDVFARPKAGDDDTQLIPSVVFRFARGFDPELESLENMLDFIIRERLSEGGPNAPAAQLDFVGRVRPVAHIGRRSREAGLGCDLREQPGEMTGREEWQRRVERLLESCGRIGTEADAGRGPADRGRLEGRDFEQERVGLGSHLRSFTAHDASQCDRFVTSTNEQITGLEIAFFAVESLDRFAVTRMANHDAAVAEQASIENVIGLAEIQHHEIG